MNKQAVKAQIDVCGKMVAYAAQNAASCVDKETMWALNQAIISLEDAYKRVNKKGEE
jgi:hypothetical protein